MVDVTIAEVSGIDFSQITGFNVILIGSPNHMGSATANIKKFIDELGTLNLEGKQVVVFDTYMKDDFEKAVKKMEKQIREKAPGLKLVTPSLSIRVNGTKGPIADDELAKCQAFGAKISALIKE